MLRYNSQREVVRQLIRSYFESCRLHDDLEKLGISNRGLDFLGEQCADSAMDIVGFPVDDTAAEDESTFCRDWLFDAVPTPIEPDTLDSAVEEYVSFLYSELESVKRENPGLLS